jgi:recombination protein RecT
MSALAQATATKAVQQQKNPTVRDLIEAQKPAIERQLAGAMNSDAFIRAILSEITKSPDLQQADPKTLLGGVMLAAQLRLEIGAGMGEFYLTPRKDHGKQICLPIIGFQGFVKLALRSGSVANIQSAIVREGDDFTYGSDATRGIFHEWRPRDFDETRPMVGVLATAVMRGGGTTWAYLTKEQVEKRRPSYWQSTPWRDHGDEMAKKTAVRALAKYLPKSTDLGTALNADEQKVQHIKGLDELQVTRDDGELEVVEPATEPTLDIPAGEQA